MLRLVEATRHMFLKPSFKTPKSLIPYSLLHSCTQTLTLVSDPDADQSVSHPWPEWVKSSCRKTVTFKELETQSGMRVLMRTGFAPLVLILLAKGFILLVLCISTCRELDGDVRNAKRTHTACLKSLIRYFSRTDVQVVAAFGCPAVDRKVVNSGKRLREHMGIDERNVCSSCLLRSTCGRAYAKARGSGGGLTVDVMRLLLTFGLDHVTDKLENKVSLDERVTKSVRKLLWEMVEYLRKLKSNAGTAVIIEWNSSIKDAVHQRQGDSKHWICFRCKFLNLAGAISCVQCDERMRKSRKYHNFLTLKKGDWLCEKCNLLNFAKNTRCIECNKNPPKRQLSGGEWECDSCNYINFRRNIVCTRCDYRRPIASSL